MPKLLRWSPFLCLVLQLAGCNFAYTQPGERYEPTQQVSLFDDLAAAGWPALGGEVEGALWQGRHRGLRLLGVLQLPSWRVDGFVLGGLSDLAWDEEYGRLYALSDNGVLFHLRLTLRDGLLVAAAPIAAFPLRGADGAPLAQRQSDGEGMTLVTSNGQRRLAISFEQRPRVSYFDLYGNWLQALPLPAALQSVKRYRAPNTALEALAYDPRWGLIVAPEQGLRGEAKEVVTLYGLDGRRWRYPLTAAPNNALVAMEPLPDGRLLMLERAFRSPLQPLIITLRQVALTDAVNQSDGPAAKEGEARAQLVAQFNSADGWLLDNFEGLTHHRGWRYLMVSDDNNSFLQRTLLVYFEIIAADQAP